MNVRNATLLLILMIVAALTASLLLYPALPERLPIHWNWRGEPDGWADKANAVIMMPLAIAITLGLMHLLPRLSLRHLSVASFLDTFYYVFAVIAGMMSYIHAITLLSGLHPEQNYSRPLLSGICLSFALLGNVLGKVRRNPWMGIRTPWTLASDAVWIATHRLAARLLFVAGVLGATTLWLGMSVAICIGLLVVALLLPAIQSYFLYKQLEQE